MFIVVENILALMEQQGLNARQFEIKLGLSNGSVQGWKKGKFFPSVKALQKIADYFGVPLAFFYEDNHDLTVTNSFNNEDSIATPNPSSGTVEKILILLEKSELSTRQFEQRIGLCNASISAWKNGKASPSAKALQKIADYFELPVDYFYTNNTSETTLPVEETRTLSDEEKHLINLILSLTEEETAELSNFVDYIISKRK